MQSYLRCSHAIPPHPEESHISVHVPSLSPKSSHGLVEQSSTSTHPAAAADWVKLAFGNLVEFCCNFRPAFRVAVSDDVRDGSRSTRCARLSPYSPSSLAAAESCACRRGDSTPCHCHVTHIIISWQLCRNNNDEHSVYHSLRLTHNMRCALIF